MKYAWIDIPFFVLAGLLLIPLVVHLAGIVIGLVSDLATFGP